MAISIADFVSTLPHYDANTSEGTDIRLFVVNEYGTPYQISLEALSELIKTPPKRKEVRNDEPKISSKKTIS